MGHVTTHDQAADMFTKPLPKMLFDNYKTMIGMKDGNKIKFMEEC